MKPLERKLRLGELCAGYGGLGLAVEEVFGATTAWFSEFDAAPSKILAHHWPDVPNYGDMTAIDWAEIEHVDIISGGTPCQDLSGAGRRAGMNEGTRSNLWVQMREAVAIQKPRYVVWENVRGAFSAEASSSVEQCPGCVGDTSDGRIFLRALGRVLGDLSDLGYDTQWRGLRAADVGSCHPRFRVFVLGTLRDSNSEDVEGQRPSRLNVPHMAAGARERRSPGLAIAGSSRFHRRHVRGAAAKPEGHDSTGGRPRDAVSWGRYERGIRSWESVMGRRAPAPTERSNSGGQRITAAFTEWMMGLPDGWVTDPAIGISRNEQLKACGNGVVPQQAMAALRDMLSAFENQKVAA